MTTTAVGPSGVEQLHNRLAVLRAERGATGRQLAEAVAVNVQTVGFLERSDDVPSVELALGLAAHFDLPVEAIFSLAPFPPMSAQLYPSPTSTPASAPTAPPTTPATSTPPPAPAVVPSPAGAHT